METRYAKRALRFTALLLLVQLPQSIAATSEWQPATTVELIAAASPGSVHDRLARATTRIMDAHKLVPSALIVGNRQGGGGTLALSYLSQNQGNPHYLSTATGTLLTNHITGLTKLRYTDFTLVALLFSDYNVFTVRSDSPIRDGRELLERVRADPKSVSFAFGVAPGNYNHIAIARVAKAANADVRQIRAVVYDGGGKAVIALLGGHVDVLVGGPGNIVGHVQSGKLRAIAVSAPQRYEVQALAGVATWKEQGANIVADNPYYILGPQGLQQSQIDFWEEAFAKVIKTKEWREFARKEFWTTLDLRRDQASAYLKSKYEDYEETLRELGLAK